ncbi:hypothetical protein, partial [Staphylococcus aureus]
QRDGRFKDEIIPIRVNSVEYTNAYNVTTHADGTATYGPRVTK